MNSAAFIAGITLLVGGLAFLSPAAGVAALGAVMAGLAVVRERGGL